MYNRLYVPTVLVSMKERKVDLLRTLFDSSWKYDSDEDAKVAQQYRSYLEEELLKQVMVVRGKDRESHAVVIKMPRESPETNEEAFIMAQLYIAERAMAATEFLSCGENEKVVAIFEFGTYSSSNAPPFRVMRSMTTILQRNYPERLFHLVILDPPFFMRTIYTLIHPFLSADTNEKVILISNEVRCFYCCNSTVLLYMYTYLSSKPPNYCWNKRKRRKRNSGR